MNKYSHSDSVTST